MGEPADEQQRIAPALVESRDVLADLVNIRHDGDAGLRQRLEDLGAIALGDGQDEIRAPVDPELSPHRPSRLAGRAARPHGIRDSPHLTEEVHVHRIDHDGKIRPQQSDSPDHPFGAGEELEEHAEADPSEDGTDAADYAGVGHDLHGESGVGEGLDIAR